MRKILCLTLEPISAQMAGPAIRCLELSRQLAQEFSVTVASPCVVEKNITLETSATANLVVRAGAGKSEIHALARDADILFIQANVLRRFPALATMGKFLIVDLYDPYLFTLIAQFQDHQTDTSASYRLMHQLLEKHMLACDFAVCATERQRDYWLGRFCALGRVDQRMFRFDPSLRKLIDIAPFGLPQKPPVKSGPGMKETIAGINADDNVLLWSGGIWQWFDPLTIIRALYQCQAQLPHVKLFFMGSQSPNPKVPLMPVAVEAQKLAQELGLLNTKIFFAPDWIEYDQRANYLLEADAAVSAHFDNVETRFSFRTRLLDNFWAGLPVLTTEGDELANLIDEYQAGISLPEKDVDAWASGIQKITLDRDFNMRLRRGAQTLAARYTWDKAAAALIKFCRDPYHLPAFRKISMPSILERVQSVYVRGGKDLIWKRSREAFHDMLR